MKIDKIIRIKDFHKYKNLEIKGSFILYDVPLEELPEGLKVGQSLILVGTKTKKLPNFLNVGKHLILKNNPIKKLPDNLKIKGRLNLSNTLIKELPNGLVVGADYKGYGIILGHTKIDDLPKDLIVKGDIVKYYSSLEEKKRLISKDKKIILPEGVEGQIIYHKTKPIKDEDINED